MKITLKTSENHSKVSTNYSKKSENHSKRVNFTSGMILLQKWTKWGGVPLKITNFIFSESPWWAESASYHIIMIIKLGGFIFCCIRIYYNCHEWPNSLLPRWKSFMTHAVYFRTTLNAIQYYIITAEFTKHFKVHNECRIAKREGATNYKDSMHNCIRLSERFLFHICKLGENV